MTDKARSFIDLVLAGTIDVSAIDDLSIAGTQSQASKSLMRFSG